MLVNFQMFSQKRENNWELFVINKTLQVLDKTIWKYPSFSYFLWKMKSIFPLLETKKNNVISLSQVPVMKIDTGSKDFRVIYQHFKNFIKVSQRYSQHFLRSCSGVKKIEWGIFSHYKEVGHDIASKDII